MNSTKTRWILRVAAGVVWAAPVAVALMIVYPPVPVPRQVNAIERPREKQEDRFVTRADRIITEKEWEDTLAFLKEYSPNRYRQVNNIGVSEHLSLKHHLVNQYRNLIILEKEQPKLYQTRLHTIRLEDDVFGLSRDLKFNRGDKQKKHAELKSKIAELVGVGLEERSLRVELVEKALTEQKKTLDYDKQHRDELTNKSYQAIIANGVIGGYFEVGKHLGQKNKPPLATEPSPGDSPGK